MPTLNKLSIDFLHEAVTREQVAGGTPFVLYGHEPTLEAVRAFLKALGRDSWGTLWGIPLVRSYRMGEDSLVLGATVSNFPEAEDYVNVFKAVLESTSAVPSTTVWGRLLRLS